VARSTSRLDEDEQRLAALWEHESEDGAAHTESADDAIAALFSSSPDDAAHVRPTARRTRRCSTRPGVHRSHARARPPRLPTPRRLLVLGVAVVAALVIAFVAPGAFTGAPDGATDRIRNGAVRTDETVAAQRSTPAEPEAGRRQGARHRHVNPAETPRQTDDVRRDRVRASRRNRDSPPRAHSRRRSARPADVTASPPPRPPTPASRQVTPPTPLSPACDEFPPC
jgi:hypothetical protein